MKSILILAAVIAALVLFQQLPNPPSPAERLVADCERHLSKLERRARRTDSPFEYSARLVEIDQTRSMCDVFKLKEKQAKGE